MTLVLAAAASSVHETEKLVSFTLIQLVAILVAARLSGKAARLLGQPRVVGEIIGGLILGPSLFGRLFPDQFDFVFKSISAVPMIILSQIGLALLMFQIGLEFDFSHLRKKQTRAAVFSVSAAGIILPLALGWLIGGWSHESLAPGINLLGYRLFLAVALSITAIPILGRIMMELGITKTRLGAIAITAAAMDDVTGWTLIAIVSALATSDFSVETFATQVGLLLAYLAVCHFVFRPLLKRLVDKFMGTSEHLPHDLLATIITVVFVSGLITYKLGVFTIFGGFIVGVMLHDHTRFVAAWKNAVSHFVTVFFLPIFFTFTGLRTNVHGLNSPMLWGWCLVIIGAATFGKFFGCSVAARFCGLSWADAGCLGIMMNTRALMELVVINVGFDLGVIPPNVFTMLVLMAIFSTVITAPFMRLYFRKIGYKYELLPGRMTSLWELWQATAARYAEKIVVIDADTGRAWSAAQLTAKAEHLATMFRGSYVPICQPNSALWLATFLAIQKIDAAAVPLDISLPPETQRETIRRLGKRPRSSICCVKLTSGTTGDLKRIFCSAANLRADGEHIIHTMGLRPTDRNLAIIPLGHSYGLGNLVMPLLLQGTAVVCAQTFVPRQILRLIEEREVTVLPTVPAILRALAQLEGATKLPSLRLVISAGAPLSAEVAQQFHRRNGIKIHNFYGSSETGGICYDGTGTATLSGRSVGKPLVGVKVRIRRDDRITVSSRAGSATLPDLGEWNRYGELSLLGRVGEVANLGGKKVAPAEIERILRELDSVSDAWVTILQDKRGNDYLAAAVESTRTRAEIEQGLLRALPPWKLPKAWLIAPALPRTARGKLHTAELRARFDALA